MPAWRSRASTGTRDRFRVRLRVTPEKLRSSELFCVRALLGERVRTGTRLPDRRYQR